jgi:hypothetical protein
MDRRSSPSLQKISALARARMKFLQWRVTDGAAVETAVESSAIVLLTMPQLEFSVVCLGLGLLTL